MEATPVGYSEENDTDINENQKSPKKQTHHRKRLKHKYNAIRQQMEFYFGDANLSKDRFLKQLINKDRYVPLDVLLTFNKLKQLTTSVEEIAKSLSNSELLEVDPTKRKVCRKTALPADRNVDNKTLYVEALPPTATHDWVRKIFEKFGPVTYVSLPKYASSRKLKEFGFIEFEQEVSVEKAVRSFKEFNGVLNMEETDPAELQSVTSFVKELKQNEEQQPAKEKQSCKKREFKMVGDSETASEEPKMKKNKMEPEEDSAPAEQTGDSEVFEEEDDKQTQSSSSSTSDEERNREDPLIEKTDKPEVVGEDKTKRRKRKKKFNKGKKRQEDPGPEPSYYDLKILPKRDWKRLRNKYLNLQRERIAEMKRKTFQERQNAQRHPKNLTEQVNDETAGGIATPQQNKPNEKFHKMNMNFYGAGGEDEPQAKKQKHNVALERNPRFTFEAGIIVEVGFLEPCVNLKEFKEEMRQYLKVKYIDVKEGSMTAHLRLETPLAADEFVRQISCAEYRCKILTGDSETEYWKKIERDREIKLNKKVRVPQKRGREKIKKTLSKHIRFGDEDEDK